MVVWGKLGVPSPKACTYVHIQHFINFKQFMTPFNSSKGCRNLKPSDSETLMVNVGKNGTQISKQKVIFPIFKNKGISQELSHIIQLSLFETWGLTNTRSCMNFSPSLKETHDALPRWTCDLFCCAIVVVVVGSLQGWTHEPCLRYLHPWINSSHTESGLALVL